MSTACQTSGPDAADGAARVIVPLGTVGIVPETRELVMTGYVNRIEGAVELFACGPGGKTHESIFMLHADPKDVQAGLLLLGYKHGPPMPGLGEKPPVGDAVEILVEWELDGMRVMRKAEMFLYDTIKKGRGDHGAWVFNGSEIKDGFFMAGTEESIIATYWDPWAIINIQSELGNDDERLSVNRTVIPPLHTPVSVIIRPVQNRKLK